MICTSCIFTAARNKDIFHVNHILTPVATPMPLKTTHLSIYAAVLNRFFSSALFFNIALTFDLLKSQCMSDVAVTLKTFQVVNCFKFCL